MKCQKSEKEEAKKEEDNCEVKTNESGEHDYQDSRLDSSSNQSKVSIFASDEEKCTKEWLKSKKCGWFWEKFYGVYTLISIFTNTIWISFKHIDRFIYTYWNPTIINKQNK